MDWIIKRGAKGNIQVIGSRNIYILPSKFGLVYVVLVLSLLTGAINYQISTIFLMTFLLAVVGLISAWETQLNLKGLSIQFISIEDAQQGVPAQLLLLIHSQEKMRYSIEFQIGSDPKTRIEKIPAEGLQIVLPVATFSRGVFPIPPIVISSNFPFGFFTVWSYAHFKESFYVYPQPLDPGFWPSPVMKDTISTQLLSGDEELYELKQVEHPWGEPNRIAWKIAAKGQGWYVKKMSSSEEHYVLFRLKDLPDIDLETKLQHLSYWLQTAESRTDIYALDLGITQTPYAQGEEHLKNSLRLLASF
jgi:uncharacterized protein (DUF58 family)